MPTPPQTRRLTPALILAAGTIAAATVLAAAVRDSTPPPLPQTGISPPKLDGAGNNVARTLDDPAGLTSGTP